MKKCAYSKKNITHFYKKEIVLTFSERYAQIFLLNSNKKKIENKFTTKFFFEKMSNNYYPF